MVKLAVLAFISASLNVTANTLWKKYLSANPISYKMPDIIYTMISPYILGGIGFYLLSMLIFLNLLSNYKLTLVIPAATCAYVLSFIAGVVFFGEKITITQILGSACIIFGIYLTLKYA